MNITTTTKGTMVFLTVVGRFDAFETPAFTTCIDGVMASGVNCLELDLRGVPFIDSSALAGLVRAAKRCTAAGGSLTLAHVSDPVQIIIELTRLEVLFMPEQRLTS